MKGIIKLFSGLLIGLMLITFTGCSKNTLEIYPGDVFDSGIETEMQWRNIIIETFNYSFAIPECVYAELNQNSEIQTENYRFELSKRAYSEREYTYLQENYSETKGLYDNGKYLFGDKYYGNFQQEYQEDGIVIAKAAVLEDEDWFGYAVYISNPNNKKTVEVLFEEKTDISTRYFYTETVIPNLFLISFSCLDDDNITADTAQEYIELHNLVLEEKVLFESGDKDMNQMIENNIEPTFEEYIAFLEMWGTYEDQSIQAAYDAGLRP